MNENMKIAEAPLRGKRLGALDTLRGVALLAMASYHFTWDLEMFGYLEPGTATQGLWKIYARAIASSFLLLAGFSLYLAHGRGIRWPSFAKRFAVIAAAAAAITVATWIAMPDGMIFFGILHNIAAASLIGLAFINLPVVVTLLAAAAAVAAPFYLSGPAFDPLILSITGLAQTTPRSNDFVPLLPWLAPFLTGIALSKIAAQRGWLSRFASTPQKSGRRDLLGDAGRHSLAFYLLHQPVLIALVYLATLIVPPAPADLAGPYIESCRKSCTADGNDAGLCERFCDCTLERLGERNLLEQMARGKLTEQANASVREIADQCTMIAQ